MALIAIIDDRVTNRNIYSRLAASIEPGVHVRAFSGPGEALAWFADNSPDLIITDYKMPDMNGADFIRNIRALPDKADVPVIVITVYEERSFRLRALEAGATDFLNSPVDHHEFVTRARNLLTLRKHQIAFANRANILAQELAHSERSRERAIRDSTERLAQVIDTLPLMISAADQNGNLLFINASQTAFLNIDPAQVIGQPMALMLGTESGAHSRTLDRIVFEKGETLPAYEEEMACSTGSLRTFLVTKSPLRDHRGKISAVLTSALDITERKRGEAYSLHLAYHDPLTGLGNKTLFLERMRSFSARAQRGDQLFALHLIDIDAFKDFNIRHGRPAGDDCLRAIGTQLGTIMRESDCLARLGSDEFAILQTNVASSCDALEFAQRIGDALSQSDHVSQNPLAITASIGVVLYSIDGENPEELLFNAELAANKAKTHGGDAYCLFSADMASRQRHTLGLHEQLHNAITNKEFVLHFQPQVDVVSGQIVAAEALLRWNRPGFGLISPGIFLPHAEESRLSIPIGEWVLRTACEQTKKWHLAGFEGLRVSVNMSPVQFRHGNVPLLVARVLAQTEFAPHCLELEITTSIVLENIASVSADIRQLVDLGVLVSMDDEGSREMLPDFIRRLPLSHVKIDRSLVRYVVENPADDAIVRAMITSAHGMGARAVAKGIESADVLAHLRDRRCDQAQGNLISSPMPAAEFERFLRAALHDLSVAKVA